MKKDNINKNLFIKSSKLLSFQETLVIVGVIHRQPFTDAIYIILKLLALIQRPPSKFSIILESTVKTKHLIMLNIE